MNKSYNNAFENRERHKRSHGGKSVTRSKKNTLHDNDNLIKSIRDGKLEGLIFIAASGVEQIGMNLNIFGVKNEATGTHKYIIVDVGISFTDLGSGTMLPSSNILEELGEENILAYVLTHGHEDHIGGLCRFLKKINKPIYSTNFTMHLIQEKLKEYNIKNAECITVNTNELFHIGDFGIIFTNTTHSIPDSNHIIIKTPYATAFHTGDWKFDESPVLGNPPDVEYLKSLGRDYNITALISDSTNAHEYKKIGTEMQAQQGLRQHILDEHKHRVIVTCFSSNVARIASLQKIAKETGRSLILIGRSLLKMVTVAIKLKMLSEEGILLDSKKAIELPPSKILYVCTGSQGEMNSVLQRAAMNLHPVLKLEKQDVAIFSSRVIPGNEKKIADIKNMLLHKKVKIIDHNTANEEYEVIHVSGHPGQQDITNIVKYVKPSYVIPVHGDLSHLIAMETLMKKINCPCVVPTGNGTVFLLHDKNGVEILGKLQTHTEVVDGTMAYPLHDEIFKQRAMLSENGVLIVIIQKRRNILFNFGVVSMEEWENLKTHINKIIGKMEANVDMETVRSDISYWIYKKYQKHPVLRVFIA